MFGLQKAWLLWHLHGPAFVKNLLLLTFLICLCRVAFATQADDTIITIDRQIAGNTPFLSQLTLSVSNTASIKSIQFTIAPKSDSSTRPTPALLTRMLQRHHSGTLFWLS
jgi:hypothetical protein